METPRSHPHAVLAAEPRDVLPRRETSRGGAFPRAGRSPPSCVVPMRDLARGCVPASGIRRGREPLL